MENSTPLQPQTDDQVIDQFVDKLIVDKGLSDIKEENKTKLKAALKERLIDQINQTVLYRLPDDKFAEFEEAAKKEDVTAEQLSGIIQSSNLDLGGIVRETMGTFRRVFLEVDIKKKAEA